MQMKSFSGGKNVIHRIWDENYKTEKMYLVMRVTNLCPKVYSTKNKKNPKINHNNSKNNLIGQLKEDRSSEVISLNASCKDQDIW